MGRNLLTITESCWISIEVSIIASIKITYDQFSLSEAAVKARHMGKQVGCSEPYAGFSSHSPIS